MKIVRTLKINPDEFFDQVERGVLSRMGSATGESDLDPAAISSGRCFIEDADDPRRRSETRIIEYTRGKRFESRTVSVMDDVTMSYEVGPAEAGDGITVVYRQDMASFNARKKGLMKGFSEAVYLGRMAEQLFKIQDEVFAVRERS